MKNVISSVLEGVATFVGNCGNKVLEKRTKGDSKSEDAYSLMRIVSMMKVGEAESYVRSPDFWI